MFVNKNDAIKNLANPKDFDVFKARFLKNYKNAVEKIVSMLSSNNIDELYSYLTAINNISLSVGSNILFDDTNKIIEKLKMGEINQIDFDNLYTTIRSVYQELEVI